MHEGSLLLLMDIPISSMVIFQYAKVKQCSYSDENNKIAVFDSKVDAPALVTKKGGAN